VFEIIDHIGIASKDVAKTIATMREVFGLEPHFDEEVDEQKVRAVGFAIGATNLEFLEPTNPQSPIARYLEKRGEGMHHIAFRVSDIDAAIARARAAGLRMIDEEARIGAEGKRIAFIHPKSVNGMLIELTEVAG
jgi:methylmalonyl-CoA epimerase